MAGTTINPYRFGGQIGYRRDGPNRLYIRERHLDTSRGRWLSRDPISVAAPAFNFYWYVDNNPVTAIDPQGLLPKAAPLKSKHRPKHGNCRKDANGCYSSPSACNNSSCISPLPFGSIRGLAAAALSPLAAQGCFGCSNLNGQHLVNFLATVLACITGCESNQDPACYTYFKGNPLDGPVYGLYQLSLREYNSCGGVAHKLCDASENTKVRVAQLNHWCAKKGDMFSALKVEMGGFANPRCLQSIAQAYPNYEELLKSIHCNDCSPKGCF